MKFLVIAGCAALLGFVVYMENVYQPPVVDPDAAYHAAKSTIVEAETKVRPARFEQMKWHHGDGGPVEMRAPASKKK